MAAVGVPGVGAAAEDAAAQPGGDDELPAEADKAAVATPAEVRGWYIFDFANSPFYQVLDTTCKVLLQRMATLADDRGSFVSWMSPESYSSFIIWVTSGAQVIALLFCSAYADYGNNRKAMLRRLTIGGSLCSAAFIFFFDSKLWPIAGALRVVCGVQFASSLVYYNSFLPVICEHHYDVVPLSGQERADMLGKVADLMSNYGHMTGFAGGLLYLLVCIAIQVTAQSVWPCDTSSDSADDCGEFRKLFFLCVCMGFVGVWWFGFSLYTWRHLQQRRGKPLPAGLSGVLALCRVEVGEAFLTLCRKRHCGFMLLAFFLYGDALSTMLNLAVLVLEGTLSTSDVYLFVNFALAPIGALIGAFLWGLVQWKFDRSVKFMLMLQTGVFSAISFGCVFGLPYSTIGFYAAFAPVMLTMGALFANARSAFSQLIPVGQEAQMFALFEITDKGSSLIGTLVTGVVHTTTDSYTGAFLYVALAFLIGGLLLLLVDMEKGQVDAGRRAPPSTS